MPTSWDPGAVFEIGSSEALLLHTGVYATRARGSRRFQKQERSQDPGWVGSGPLPQLRLRFQAFCFLPWGTLMFLLAGP